ncbi:hypothetical protein [Thiolapillus sp.]|uniref:hypothetical protein n=1 Tax=Thiolapillus sp. TaxID=2017437 RepID=UPI003AF674C5
MLKKPTCRKLLRPQCLCVLAKLFVDDDCWKSKERKKTTLGGGSLGSCVDEERSQLRELM